MILGNLRILPWLLVVLAVAAYFSVRWQSAVPLLVALLALPVLAAVAWVVLMTVARARLGRLLDEQVDAARRRRAGGGR